MFAQYLIHLYSIMIWHSILSAQEMRGCYGLGRLVQCHSSGGVGMESRVVCGVVAVVVVVRRGVCCAVGFSEMGTHSSRLKIAPTPPPPPKKNLLSREFSAKEIRQPRMDAA